MSEIANLVWKGSLTISLVLLVYDSYLQRQALNNLAEAISINLQTDALQREEISRVRRIIGD